MQTIPVRCANASYDILVGAGIVENIATHLSDAGLRGPFLVVSQPRILKSLGRRLEKVFPVALIPDGERAKSLTTVSRLLDRMVELKMTRQSTILGVGGG